jgi:enediyne biosynthesis protein E4
LMRQGSQLVLRELPLEAQLSPVFAIEVLDLDNDQTVDIVLGGNYYKLKPEIGRLDGFNGGYFKGQGDGTFIFVSATASGIRISGEVRDIAQFDKHLIFARNNLPIISFSRRK